MKTLIELDPIEVQMMVDDLNLLLDSGLTEIVTARGELWPIRPMLRKYLIAGLKSGVLKLPACFTGDQELIDAAAEAEIQRKFEETFPDPLTKH